MEVFGIAKGPSCLKMWLKEDGFVERVKEWWHSYNVLGPLFCLSKEIKIPESVFEKAE